MPLLPLPQIVDLTRLQPGLVALQVVSSEKAPSASLRGATDNLNDA